MINKKIISLAIAAAFTTNAFAAIDLDVTPVASLTYSSEAIVAASVKDGKIVVSDAGGDLNVTTKAGFAIPLDTTRFVRFELTNAEFETALVDGNLTVAISGAGNAAVVSKLTGGAKDDTFVVYQVSTDAAANSNVLTTGAVTLAIADLDISTTLAASIKYTMHADLSNAVAGTAPLYTKSGTVAKFATSVTGKIAVATDAADGSKALVAKDFTTFTEDGQLASTGKVGKVTAAGYLVSGTVPLQLNSDATTLANSDLDASQVLSFAGDFSFGTWVTATAKDCTTGRATVTLNDAKTVATTAAVNITGGTEYWLCVENGTKKDTIKRGSYSVTLVDDKITATLGEFTYDTTSVAVPYLTTYTDYNQRIYLINSGSTAAKYTTSFRSEDGVTAVAGTAATGTIPAGKMISIKAADLVTLTGKTRTSASIEIEAAKDNIKGTSQTVNLGDSSTDTLELVVSQ